MWNKSGLMILTVGMYSLVGLQGYFERWDDPYSGGMFQPGIEAYLDAIKQQYDTVLAENRSLRQENIRLTEANGQYVRKIQYYTSVLNRQKHMPVGPSEGGLPRAPKCLKRGSDWKVDGDRLGIVSMRERVAMPWKITNAVVSRCGRFVAFGCGYKVFLEIEKMVWLLDPSSERMVRYEAGMLEGETQEYKICPMDFTDDSLYLYVADGRGGVRMWSLTSKAQEGMLACDPIAIKAVKNLVFVADWSRAMKVYDGGSQVASVTSGEEFSGPMAVSRDGSFVYAVASRNKILVLDVDAETTYLTSTGEERILAMAISPEHMMVSVGGYRRSAGLYRIKAGKPSCRPQDAIEQRGVVLSLGFIQSHLLVGQPEGVMIWDLKEKTSMRIQIHESNVIGISVGEGCFSTVDNNGVLRIWSYKAC